MTTATAPIVTKLHPPWLLLARLVWVILVLLVVGLWLSEPQQNKAAWGEKY